MKQTHTAEFKAKLAIDTLQEIRTVNEIASANGISPNLLFRWKSKAVSRLPQVFKKETEKLTKQRQAFEAIIAELYRQIGKLSTEGWNGLKKIWLSS